MKLLPFRDWILAASMANLCLLRVWSRLLEKSVLTPDYPARDYLAALANLALVAVGWRVVLFLRRSSDRRPARKVFALAPLLPLLFLANHVRRTFPETFNLGLGADWLGRTGILSLAVVSAALGIYLLTVRFQFVVRLAEILVLILSPFLLVTLGRAAWFAETIHATNLETPPPRPISAPESSARVLWLLFDEMDQRLAFSQRPAGLSLPELDRFREQAVYAPSAFPPGPDTRTSVLSMLSGRVVLTSEAGPTDMMVTFEPGEKPIPWSTLQPNLFSSVRDRGLPTAIAGWYLPYCRLLGANVTECSWQPFVGMHPDPRAGLLPVMLDQVALGVPLRGMRENVAKYRMTLQTAKKLVANRDPGLVLLHWMIPHEPGIYDRKTGQLTTLAPVPVRTSYLDNLALVDRTLGEMRQVMQEAGTWESTAILITSDHAWRQSARFDGKRDPRVPFLLKLPGQTKPLTYNRAFNTVLIHDLLLALLNREVSEPQEVARWLDQHPTELPSPTTSSPDGE